MWLEYWGGGSCVCSRRNVLIRSIIQAAKEAKRASEATVARPPPFVPVGTLLYGEKGYSTGTRVRASRYGIRECSGVSLWDALMFGRVLEY